MASDLDSGYVPKTVLQLFNVTGGFTSENFNPFVFASVTLPGGTQQYQFSYNNFGEIVRVKLPTGGEYHYRYDGPGVLGDPTVRRIFAGFAEIGSGTKLTKVLL